MATNSVKVKKHFISEGIDSFFIDVYGISRFIYSFFKEVFVPPYEIKETINQCFKAGYQSLPLISATAFITGMVFTDHSRPALSDFGATSWLPSVTGVAIIKALAPLISALICAGKTGSQIGAEIGSMRVTEQIDAMEVSAINPFKYLVVSRVLATTLSMPLLMLYSAVIGLAGSFIDVAAKDKTNFGVFVHDAFAKLGYAEICSTLLRSLIFGFTIGIIGCYKGYTATKGTEGVGRAANASVIIIMFLIFLEEITVVKIFNAFYTKQA